MLGGQVDRTYLALCYKQWKAQMVALWLILRILQFYVGTRLTVHYVFRSIAALHSFRLKLYIVKYIVQC